MGNWFGDWILRAAGWAAGFSQPQLDAISRVMPNLRKLIAIINKGQPIIQQAVPLINEAMPLVQEASKEFQTLKPVLEMALKVIQRDLDDGKSREEAIENVKNALSRI